jgi:hypothetical protein
MAPVACTAAAAQAQGVVARPGGNALRSAAPLRAARTTRRSVVVAAGPKLDLHSNVFTKELVK